MAIIGVDEAGKGPVLGSMFAAAIRTPSRDTLPDGITDSKQLTAARREELASAMRVTTHIDIAVAEIPPHRIDQPTTDMNTLTVAAHAEAIAAVADPPVHVITDASDVDADRFARRIHTRVPAVDVTATHKADTTEPVVAAASIIAKVERDAHVAQLAERYGDIGSGYPSDPTTRAFLVDYAAQHGTIPPCARRSWATSTDLIAAVEQSTLHEF